MNYTNVNIRLYNEETDSELPWFDHTRTAALLTCPRAGMLHYFENKVMDSERRELALECGDAMHKGFSACRLLTINKNLIDNEGLRIFGNKVWNELSDKVSNPEQFILSALYSTGYEDDPEDRKRTLNNMEEALIYYYNNCEKDAVLVINEDNNNTFVGIEHNVNFVVDFTLDTKEIKSLRFLGRADGIHISNNGITVEENKTTSMSLSSSWLDQWETAHQLTGYIIDIGLKTGENINIAKVIGLQIPLPKLEFNGLRVIPVQRYPRQFDEWASWLAIAFEVYERYKNNVLKSPMFTHSCNNYFRTCQYLPMCAGDEDLFKYAYDNLELKVWHPHE